MNDLEVHRLVSEIWSTVLGLDVEVADPPRDPEGERTITGFVHVSGDWHGTVSLACPTALALDAAATMFGTPVEELTDDDVKDALGELTNMTGGGVKSLLPGSCDLSLPTVVEGLDYTVSVPGTSQWRFLSYSSQDHPVVIRVLEKVTAAV
jgi:chemotaxis protein CheX